MDAPITTTSPSVPPSSLMSLSFPSSSSSSMSPDPDVKPRLKMQDFTKPRTEDLMVRRPVKKRKSWGQQLPEPKTDLAPRKRAKTDDEKEQRRIERIKRNRAAAHNSRERKRVEAEHLANANDILVQRIQALQRRLAQQDAQLEKCKELLPEGLPSVMDDDIAYDKDYFPDSTSTSPAYTIDPRASLSLSESSQDSPHHATEADVEADAEVKIKLEDDSTLSHTLFTAFDDKPEPKQPDDSTLGSIHPSQGLDQIQHSAAMLCDLQCRSSPKSPLSTPRPSPWTTCLTILLHTHLMSIYRSVFLTLWTLFPSQIQTHPSFRSRPTKTSSASPQTRLPNSLTLTRLALRISTWLRQEYTTMTCSTLTSPVTSAATSTTAKTAMNTTTAAAAAVATTFTSTPACFNTTRTQPSSSRSTLAQLLVATGLCSSGSSAHLLALDSLVLKQLASALMSANFLSPSSLSSSSPSLSSSTDGVGDGCDELVGLLLLHAGRSSQDYSNESESSKWLNESSVRRRRKPAALKEM